MTASARTHAGVRLKRLIAETDDRIEPGEFVTLFRHTMETMITTVICCPVCSSKTVLGPLHRVDADGYVSPAVKCSNEACPFLEYIQLDGWGVPI